MKFLPRIRLRTLFSIYATRTMCLLVASAAPQAALAGPAETAPPPLAAMAE